jgi:hypothetical protein
VKKGRGHQITGHHEIMLPLLRQALIEMSDNSTPHKPNTP